MRGKPLVWFASPTTTVVAGQRGLSLLILVALCWAGCMSPSASALSPFQTGGGNSPIDIRADQQSYNAALGESVFEGGVILRYQTTEIKSPKATVSLSSDGKAKVATFSQRPTVRHTSPGKAGEDILTADWVDIDIAGSHFRARGNVVSNLATVAANPIRVTSDVQQYHSPTGVITAEGHVTVHYEDVTITSNKALLRTGGSGAADRVVFLGNAVLRQKDSQVRGERITIVMANKNIVAEGGVKTTVNVPDNGAGKPSRVFLNSAFQQFDNATNTILASGAVKLVYEDYLVTGPKASFKLKPQGESRTIDRIYLTGRPTITDNERKITADKIVITPNPKAFDAQGNVKTQFQSKPASAAQPPAPKNGTPTVQKKTSVQLQPANNKPAEKPPVLTEEEELQVPPAVFD